MEKTVLITFGCSWTFGEGSGYTEGMTKEEYESIQHNTDICWENGWRKPLVEHFDFDHINLAEYGSSNDRQFRCAKEFFTSDKFKDLYQSKSKIIVLWGITSTNRYDFWINSSRNYEKIFLNNVEDDVIKYKQEQDYLGFALKRYSYNELNRVSQLVTEISFWNQYFKLLNIKNFWFDTFSSLSYGIKFNNFFDIHKKNRSLVNVIVKHHRKNNISKIKFINLDYNSDFTYAIQNNILNSYSYHPKKEYYDVIKNYLIEKLEEYLKL